MSRRSGFASQEGYPIQSVISCVAPDDADQAMGEGLQRWPDSMATRPQPSQTYFMADSLSLHMCWGFAVGVPQKLHLDASSQGLQR